MLIKSLSLFVILIIFALPISYWSTWGNCDNISNIKKEQIDVLYDKISIYREERTLNSFISLNNRLWKKLTELNKKYNWDISSLNILSCIDSELEGITANYLKKWEYNFELELTDLIERDYSVVLPKNYNPEKSYPLVIFFHWWFGSSEQAKWKYWFLDKVDELGFILAYWNWTKIKLGKNMRVWNAWKCCWLASKNQVDDMLYVDEMIKDISHKINIDDTRIFSTWFSNWWLLSHKLACEMSTTFSSIAAVSWTDNTLKCNPKRNISILNIHWVNDENLPYNWWYWKGFANTDFTSVGKTFSNWINRNKCNLSDRTTINENDINTITYNNCNNSTKVKLIKTEASHEWLMSDTFNTTDEILSFFWIFH